LGRHPTPLNQPGKIRVVPSTSRAQNEAPKRGSGARQAFFQKESPSGSQGFRGCGSCGGQRGGLAPAREDNSMLGVLFRSTRDFCRVAQCWPVIVATIPSSACRGLPIQLASAQPQRLPSRPSQQASRLRTSIQYSHDPGPGPRRRAGSKSWRNQRRRPPSPKHRLFEAGPPPPPHNIRAPKKTVER
jgi:hypothetical protein